LRRGLALGGQSVRRIALSNERFLTVRFAQVT
jgi:hypothetical protein